MESYSVTGNFQGFFPQSAGAPGRFQPYLSLGILELPDRRPTRLQVFAFKAALFSLLVWSFPRELQGDTTLNSPCCYIQANPSLFDQHIIQRSTSEIPQAGRSYSYGLLLARTLRCSETWPISLRSSANRISRAPT